MYVVIINVNNLIVVKWVKILLFWFDVVKKIIWIFKIMGYFLINLLLVYIFLVVIMWLVRIVFMIIKGIYFKFVFFFVILGYFY